MKLRRFCAKCGKSFKPHEAIHEGFICGNCLGFETQENFVIDYKFRVRECQTCGAFSLQNHDYLYPWEFRHEREQDIDFVTRVFYEKIFFQKEKKDNAQYSLFLPHDFSLKDLTEKKDVKLVIQQTLNSMGEVDEQIRDPIQEETMITFRKIFCEHCGQKMGGRFNSVLQLRIQHPNDKARLELIILDCRRISDELRLKTPDRYISKEEKVANGYDLKLSNISILKKLVALLRQMYYFEVKFSKRLMGRSSETGGEVYRHSTLLRLIPVVKDDRIEFENVQYRVKKLIKNRVLLEDINSHAQKPVSFSDFQTKSWKFLDN